MDWIFKAMPVSSLLLFVPMILVKIGNVFKNKDQNNVGPDDAFGNVLIALAPAVEAATSAGSDTALRKALKVVRDTIDGYLSSPPSAIG